MAFDILPITSGNAPIGMVVPDRNSIGTNRVNPIAVTCLTLLHKQDSKKPIENIAVTDKNNDNKNDMKLPCSDTSYLKYA